MFRFPWGDFHSLNLGWFLQKFNELREDWATAEAGIDGALDAEIQKAEDALTDVFAARDAAAASASAANSSALNASQSSLASMDARDQSRAARDAAQQAATNAAASETAAGNSATAASNSAGAAATSATQAGQSATNAAGSATAAANSATAAGNSATAAAGSATAAGNSAAEAAQSAADAAASAAAIDGVAQQYNIGFNLCDEIFERGAISATTGENEGTEQAMTLRTKNYIPINEKIKYFCYCVINGTTNMRTRFYDAEKNYIGYVNRNGNAIQWNNTSDAHGCIPPVGACFLRFSLPETYGITYQNDICINAFQSNLEIEPHNGQYVPYGATDNLMHRILNNEDGFSNIAKILDSYIADTALTPNDLRIIENKLFRITSNIPAGASIIPGTNCQKTTIADILKTLL